MLIYPIFCRALYHTWCRISSHFFYLSRLAEASGNVGIKTDRPLGKQTWICMDIVCTNGNQRACCHVNLNDGKIHECHYLCCSWYLRTCAAAFQGASLMSTYQYLVKASWKSSSQTPIRQWVTNQRSFNVTDPMGPSASVLLLLQPLLVGRVSPSELRNVWHSPSVEN